MSYTPDFLRYSSAHVWLELLDDGLIRIGITDYAQQQLGDIVYVELPETERSLNAGDECAVVESVKSASDIYCPVSGEIIEVNRDLESEPEKINSAPYGEGWIFLLKPDSEDDLEELLDADKYNEFIEGEDN